MCYSTIQEWIDYTSMGRGGRNVYMYAPNYFTVLERRHSGDYYHDALIRLEADCQVFAEINCILSRSHICVMNLDRDS